MKQLDELLDEVNNPQTFLHFVNALSHDALHSTGNEWANGSVSEFLSASVSWAEDSDFGISQDPALADNVWQQFAVFLYCGKFYE